MKMPVKMLLSLLIVVLGLLPAVAQIGPPPIIIVQPLGLSVLQKDTATFAVVAVSGTSMSYQWYKDGKKIGPNKSIYTKNDVKADDAGVYYVQVKNASGTVTSSNAVLLVVDKNPVPINIARMTPTGFNLQLEGLTGSRCVIYASTNMVNWTPIATNTPSGGCVNVTDSRATNRPFCYYKAEIE